MLIYAVYEYWKEDFDLRNVVAGDMILHPGCQSQWRSKVEEILVYFGR